MFVSNILQDLGYASLTGIPPVYGLCKLTSVNSSMIVFSTFRILKDITRNWSYFWKGLVCFSKLVQLILRIYISYFSDSSFVPPLVYAVLGTSRNIAIGPVAVVSLLLGELLKQELSPTEDAAEYLQLAFTATFFAGIFQAGLGILRYISCPFMYQKFPNEYWRLNHAKDGPGFTRHFLVPFLTHGCFV